ncbi:unnamed protein product [Camellia sinensis]
MAFKAFISRVASSFKLCRSKHPSNIPDNPIQLSPSPLFVDCQSATPLSFKKPHRSLKHHVSSFLVCGFRTHEDDLPESPPCKWDETPRRGHNSSISSDSDDELFPPPPPTPQPITTSIFGDSDDELFPPPPTPTRHSIPTSLADSGLCGYESDDEEEDIVTLSLNRKKRMQKLLPSFPAEWGLKRSKMEGGRSLLERCDNLLHSIAEMTSGTELQQSTVSVLDSSFYKDESSSPSPVMKRSIEFKGEFEEDIWSPAISPIQLKWEDKSDELGEFDEDIWSPAISPNQSKCENKSDELGEFDEDIWSPAISPNQSKCEDKSDDCDFVYISEILRASNYLPEDYDIFQLLEKQQYLKGNDTSGVSSLERKLIFDTVSEILDRNREMPSWKVLSRSNSSIGKPSLHQIWSEFQRIRERDTAEDLFDIVCGVPRKDLIGDAISGWRDCPVEMSEATLDIERMIFKDLISETIGDLVAFVGNRKSTVRRKWFSDAKGIGKPF